MPALYAHFLCTTKEFESQELLVSWHREGARPARFERGPLGFV